MAADDDPPRREPAPAAHDQDSGLLRLLRLVRSLPERAGGPRMAGVISALVAIIIGVCVAFYTAVRYGGDLAIKLYPMVAEWWRLDAQTERERLAAEGGATADQLDRIEAQGAQTDLTVRAIGEDVQRLDGRVTAIEDAHD